MSDVKFTCPSCGQHIKCEESHIGENIPCPGCAHMVRVPPNATFVPETPPTATVNPFAVPTLEENIIAEKTGAASPSDPPMTEREQQIAAARAAHAQTAPVIKPRLSFILSGGQAPPREENESAVTTVKEIHPNDNPPDDPAKSVQE